MRMHEHGHGSLSYTARTPASPQARLAARSFQNDSPDSMTPTAIIGICMAAGACAILALALLIRHLRKAKNQANRSAQQIEFPVGRRTSASDDTHVVDFVYGEKLKVRTSYEDYHGYSSGGPKAVSRAALTNSVILPLPAAAARVMAPRGIDVQRANDPGMGFPSPPALFPGTPSSVHSFYGPAIARTQAERQLPQSSAPRALALAAGVSSPTSSSFKPEARNEGLELPMQLSRFRESTFGNGMKLGEHLGIQGNKNEPSVQLNSSTPQPASPGSIKGGFSFGGERMPYRAHKHAASSLSMADVRSVRISFVSGSTSPALAGGFPHHSPQNSVSHGRTDSTGSVATNVITRKVLTVFPPLLPDELVLAAGEKVTLLQTFDDEWCVVGRDRFGEVEVGAVPAYVFTKVKAGEQMQRPMRSTSLGVKVEMSSTPGAAWSSREEVMSWSNF